MSQDFSRTESRILGALSKLDWLLLNPEVRTCSGTVLGTSRNNNSKNREPTGDRSLNDPYSEVEFSVRQASISADSDREETFQTVPNQIEAAWATTELVATGSRRLCTKVFSDKHTVEFLEWFLLENHNLCDKNISSSVGFFFKVVFLLVNSLAWLNGVTCYQLQTLEMPILLNFVAVVYQE